MGTLCENMNLYYLKYTQFTTYTSRPGCDVVNYINTKTFIIIPSTNIECKYKHAYFK